MPYSKHKSAIHFLGITTLVLAICIGGMMSNPAIAFVGIPLVIMSINMIGQMENRRAKA